MAAYSLIKTVNTGDTITAVDRNNEHQNHINNNTPAGVTGDSSNVAGMQATVTPGSVGSESLATTLQGELERLRYMMVQIVGGTYWYSAVPTTLTTLTGANNLFNYRRPVLQYNSGTVINVETGLDGTSGDCKILFPDGTVRTDSDTTRIRCTLSQNAVFNNATRLNNVGGIRAALTLTANTWYSLYAVKVTAGSGSATDFVIVADTLGPVQANYASLNSNYGTNGWVYLGVLPYGDNAGATTAIPKFVMVGNRVSFYNTASWPAPGLRLVTNASGTTSTFTYSSGSNLASPQIATQLTTGSFICGLAASTLCQILDSASAIYYHNVTNLTSGVQVRQVNDVPLTGGLQVIGSGSTTSSIFLRSYCDGSLGIGANPLL